MPKRLTSATLLLVLAPVAAYAQTALNPTNYPDPSVDTCEFLTWNSTDAKGLGFVGANICYDASDAKGFFSDHGDCDGNGNVLRFDLTTHAYSCATLADADIPDTITASSYLPLAGGTMTGLLTLDNLGAEFTESDTNPTCAAGNYNIFADLSETAVKICNNGSSAVASTGAHTTDTGPSPDCAGTTTYQDGEGNCDDISTVYAQEGANSDITSLAGLTTPLSVAQGGTGAATLTDGGILLGSGVGAITALGVATDGQIPIGDGTTDPVLATITGTANEITVTNGAGSITISIPASPTLDGTNFTGIPVGGLANGTDGELITWSAAAAPTTVAAGTSGQVLTSNGAGAAPTFQAAAGGGTKMIMHHQTDVSGTATDHYFYDGGTNNFTACTTGYNFNTWVFLPIAVTAANLECFAETGPSSTEAHVFTLTEDDGSFPGCSDTALTCSMFANADCTGSGTPEPCCTGSGTGTCSTTRCSDTSNTVSMSIGELLTMQIDILATAPGMTWCSYELQ